jgi:acyl-CoA thioester hydrolase
LIFIFLFSQKIIILLVDCGIKIIYIMNEAVRPIVFEHQIKVEMADIDELNHVNNIVYLRYVQDAAGEHWYSVAKDTDFEQIKWVARRHEIDYLKPAFLDEILTAKTWVETFTGVTSVRHCEIYRAETLIAKSKTTWVAIDGQSFKPRRLDAAIIDLFFKI